MKIRVINAKHPDTVVIHTEGSGVVIENPFIGPIITHEGLCVSIMARDDGFEGHIWTGKPDPFSPMPVDAKRFRITENGVSFESKRLA